MIPRSISKNLARLRRRERWLSASWGAARWVALAFGLLVVCCAVDWTIDREVDTPQPVRLGLLALQMLAAAVGAVAWLLRPLTQRWPDDLLALRVEARWPALNHRLISALQLNRPGADLEGASPELVALLTREAEQASARLDFASLADAARARHALALAATVVLLATGLGVALPETASALVARQLLADVPIPRAFHLVNRSPAVWLQGETLTLALGVHSQDNREAEGLLSVMQVQGVTEVFPLVRGPGEHTVTVEVPPQLRDLRFTARLGDGRLRMPAEVSLVPRPVIAGHAAAVVLPAFCGLRPDGSRYELPQGRGDVVGIPGCEVKVRLEVQRPVAEAWVETLGEAQAQEPAVRRRIHLALDEGALGAEGTFDLRPEETAYRLVVRDEYGFENKPAPVRSLRLVPEPPPQVQLRKDDFGADADFEGMPVVLGGAIRIPYVCHGPYGLGRAQVLYRVLGPSEGSGPPPWVALPLPEVSAAASQGPFDPRRAVFADTPFSEEIPFVALPSPAPWEVLGRTQGGGRAFVRTAGLIDSAGRRVVLKENDQVEVCIEIFADADRQSPRPSGRSEPRVFTMVSPTGLRAWLDSVTNQEQRLRQLVDQQHKVFGTVPDR